jgi:beta-glucanase (GH16 family)
MTFLLSLILLIGACSEDSPEKITPTPTPTPDPDPDPVVNVPAIAPTVCDFNLDESTLTSAGWTKVFDDDFNSDLSKWNIWTGGAFNNELQYYQAPNISIADGVLSITAKKEAVTGVTTPYDATQKSFSFTSGRIESKTNVSANSTTPKVRIMARIKLPAGYALWPAFWSYGDPWPTQGEIDFLEFRGNDTKKYQTNYFYGTTAGTNLVRNAEGHITADADLTTCYHVFEMIWEKNKLTSILDGTIVEVKTSGGYIPQMFGKEQRITLNVAVGGDFFSGVDPSKIEGGAMQVDWVKVFTSN